MHHGRQQAQRLVSQIQSRNQSWLTCRGRNKLPCACLCLRMCALALWQHLCPLIFLSRLSSGFFVFFNSPCGVFFQGHWDCCAARLASTLLMKPSQRCNKQPTGRKHNRGGTSWDLRGKPGRLAVACSRRDAALQRVALVLSFVSSCTGSSSWRGDDYCSLLDKTSNCTDVEQPVNRRLHMCRSIYSCITVFHHWFPLQQMHTFQTSSMLFWTS